MGTVYNMFFEQHAYHLTWNIIVLSIGVQITTCNFIQYLRLHTIMQSRYLITYCKVVKTVRILKLFMNRSNTSIVTSDFTS